MVFIDAMLGSDDNHNLCFIVVLSPVVCFKISMFCVPGVCGCCGPLRPRYKRLVDNIFPEDPKVSILPLLQDAFDKTF